MNRKRKNVIDGEEPPCSKRFAKEGYFSRLPVELVERILYSCDDESLRKSRLVCRRWYDVIEENLNYWKKMCIMRGISADDPSLETHGSIRSIVDELKSRLCARCNYNGCVAMVKCNRKLVGVHDEGVLICIKDSLKFYKVTGRGMHQFLLDLDEDDFDLEKYDSFLTFECVYDAPLLTWTVGEEQIHLCNGNEIKILKLNRQTELIVVEDLSSDLRYNRSDLRMIVLPHNIRVIKKKGRMVNAFGVSITFSSEGMRSKRALYLSYLSSKTLLILHHGNENVVPVLSHNFSINEAGIHVRGGAKERSVDVFMGSSSMDGTFMKIHTTCLQQAESSSLIDLEVKPIIHLACNSKNCVVAAVGYIYIVLFDHVACTLLFYKRPRFGNCAIVHPAFKILVNREEFPPDIDWQSVEFIFQNDIHYGLFGNKGEVELHRCSWRENDTTFLVLCK